jgi:peptidoglycan/LPS O-acetylase OafA/YrhL
LQILRIEEEASILVGGYRRDIDGLRAVAILPVLFFHSGLSFFSGGYVGVDVFFVISGYLIAGIIAREIDDSRFSIIRFYERRARRIMPALMVMIAVVLIAACYFYLPGDFAKVPKSALLATLFLSNVGFFLQAGYFAGGSETLPLLHTWSLAVEEQFYIGFPILLILIARFVPGWRTTVIAATALLSFAIAVATQNGTSGFAFYLLPPRAWELFVGALLATARMPMMSNRYAREAISLSGFGAIAFSALTYSDATVFPGITALLPVLGTAALLYCAPGTIIGRLLETRAFVGIGLISYSLYLWHWPIIVFTEYYTEQSLTGGMSLAVIVASIVGAYLSWRFVEHPFRQSSAFDRKAIFTWTGVTMGAACAASVVLMTLNGWPSRFSAEALRLDAASADVSPVRATCITDKIGSNLAGCVLGAKVMPTTLLWGDSHGVEMAWALAEKLGKQGASLMQRTRGSCPPILGYARAIDPDCARFNQFVLDEIKAAPALTTIVLAGFWAGGAYSNDENAKMLDQTVELLIGLKRRVVLIGPVPPQPFNIPRHLANLAERGEAIDNIGADARAHLAKSAWITSHFKRWATRGVVIVEPSKTLCTATRCAASRGGLPLYFDTHHLSLAGARIIVAASPAL